MSFSSFLRLGCLGSAGLLWASTSWAQATDLQIGQSVQTAHQLLLDQGWTISTEAHQTEPLDARQRGIKSKLPSLITCSGTGQGLCAYGYSRRGQNLRLVAGQDGALLRWLP